MRERIRREWLTKDEFSCIKCNAKGKDIGWNDKGSKPRVGEPVDVLFCKKCKHELRTKEELEDLVPFVEYQQFGFYLRFIGKHFTPCVDCQNKIDEALNTKDLKDWEINAETFLCPIEVDDFSGDLRFWFKWVGSEVFIPCKECQKVLKEGIIYADKWTIGNKDYFPPIEFWSKWRINDRKTQEVEKGLIRFNGKDNFGRCELCNTMDYLKRTNRGIWLCKKHK